MLVNFNLIHKFHCWEIINILFVALDTAENIVYISFLIKIGQGQQYKQGMVNNAYLQYSRVNLEKNEQI